jgi:hypothetical protein
LGPPWIRSASFSARLSEAPWSRNSCHSACSAWSLVKWARGASTRSRSCSGRAQCRPKLEGWRATMRPGAVRRAP